MIVDNGPYYLYRHIRLDTNEVFYVGLGTKLTRYSSFKGQHYEAYKTSSRNPFWNRIVGKSKWITEIMFDCDDYEFLREKEKEFIKLYGRRDKKEGSLVNLTDGGEGAPGKIVSEKTKRKISASNMGHPGANKGISRTQQVKDAISIANKGKKRTKEEKEKIKKKREQQKMNHLYVKIIKCDSADNPLEEYNSITEAVLKNNLSTNANLIACCKGKRKSTGGYKWKYGD